MQEGAGGYKGMGKVGEGAKGCRREGAAGCGRVQEGSKNFGLGRILITSALIGLKFFFVSLKL